MRDRLAHSLVDAASGSVEMIRLSVRMDSMIRHGCQISVLDDDSPEVWAGSARIMSRV